MDDIERMFVTDEIIPNCLGNDVPSGVFIPVDSVTYAFLLRNELEKRATGLYFKVRTVDAYEVSVEWVDGYSIKTMENEIVSRYSQPRYLAVFRDGTVRRASEAIASGDNVSLAQSIPARFITRKHYISFRMERRYSVGFIRKMAVDFEKSHGLYPDLIEDLFFDKRESHVVGTLNSVCMRTGAFLNRETGERYQQAWKYSDEERKKLSDFRLSAGTKKFRDFYSIWSGYISAYNGDTGASVLDLFSPLPPHPLLID